MSGHGVFAGLNRILGQKRDGTVVGLESQQFDVQISGKELLEQIQVTVTRPSCGIAKRLLGAPYQNRILLLPGKLVLIQSALGLIELRQSSLLTCWASSQC